MLINIKHEIWKDLPYKIKYRQLIKYILYDIKTYGVDHKLVKTICFWIIKLSYTGVKIELYTWLVGLLELSVSLSQ